MSDKERLDIAVREFKKVFNPVTAARRDKQRKEYAIYVQLAWEGKR